MNKEIELEIRPVFPFTAIVGVRFVPNYGNLYKLTIRLMLV